MKRGTIAAFGMAVVCAGLAVTAEAQGLPICHVLLFRSVATETVPRMVADEIQGWIDAGASGCKLVNRIDDADVMVEFRDYRRTTTAEGVPAEEWWFAARRLSEPDPLRATHRFAFRSVVGRRARAQVAKRLPRVLTDVCLGYLPAVAATDLER